MVVSAAQLILAGLSHLTARHKIRMFKLLQRHRHLRIVQIARIGPPHGLAKLVQRKSLGEHRPCIFQCDVSVWLYGEYLIELRR